MVLTHQEPMPATDAIVIDSHDTLANPNPNPNPRPTHSLSASLCGCDAPVDIRHIMTDSIQKLSFVNHRSLYAATLSM